MYLILNVSRSGYLSNFKFPFSTRSSEDFKSLLAIKAAHHKGRGIYDAAKIQAELVE